MKISIQVTKSNIAQAPDLWSKMAEGGMKRLLEYAREYAADSAPVQSGRLSGKKGGYPSIFYRVSVDGPKVTGILAATSRDPISGWNYAAVVELGTKGPILPKRPGGVLVFLRPEFSSLPRPSSPEEWKEYRRRGYLIYTRRVRKREPNPFLRPALAKVREKAEAIFNILSDEFSKKINR